MTIEHTLRIYPGKYVEYRVVCDNPAHRNHCFEYRTRRSALKGATYLNGSSDDYNSSCVPWAVETRTITEWVRVQT